MISDMVQSLNEKPLITTLSSLRLNGCETLISKDLSIDNIDVVYVLELPTKTRYEERD